MNEYMQTISELEGERDSLRSENAELRAEVSCQQTTIGRLEAALAMISGLPKCWGLDDNGRLEQETSIVPEMTVWYKSIGGITETRAVAVEQTRIRAIGQGDGRYLGQIVPADKCYDSIAAIEVAYPEAD